MIQTQDKFSSLLEDLIGIANESKIESKKIAELKMAVDGMHLPIAVVGEFSAGKSTLLNNFIITE